MYEVGHEPEKSSITTGLLRLGGDATLWAKLAGQGRKLAELLYSAEAVRPQYLAAYRSLTAASDN